MEEGETKTTETMKATDLKLTIIEYPDGVYTAWMVSFPDIIVQVDNIKDVPKKIARSLEVVLMYGFDIGMHDISKIHKP